MELFNDEDVAVGYGLFLISPDILNISQNYNDAIFSIQDEYI